MNSSRVSPQAPDPLRQLLNLLRKLCSAQEQGGRPAGTSPNRMMRFPDPFAAELLEQAGEINLRIMDQSGQIHHCKPIGGVQLPIEFSISIKAVQKTRFAIAAQNELMLHLLDLGVIPPDQAIALMEFEGKEQVLKHLDSAQAATPPDAAPAKLKKSKQKENRNAVS